MSKIIIQSGEIELYAQLNDTETARLIEESLPIEGSVNVWGDEIYFHIPLHIDQDADAREEVDIGDLGFWPAGDAFCIFFGPTPVSVNDKPRAYSPVNVFGKITGDLSSLKMIPQNSTIRVLKTSDHDQ